MSLTIFFIRDFLRPFLRLDFFIEPKVRIWDIFSSQDFTLISSSFWVIKRTENLKNVRKFWKIRVYSEQSTNSFHMRRKKGSLIILCTNFLLFKFLKILLALLLCKINILRCGWFFRLIEFQYLFYVENMKKMNHIKDIKNINLQKFLF